MIFRNYLKFLAIIPLTVVLFATSCRETPELPPDPPVIVFTTPGDMVVNIQDTLPYIQGSVTTQGNLTNVTIFALRGAERQNIFETANFENSQNFVVNIRPPYDLEMTGILVEATDAHRQTSTKELTFKVVSEETGPIITITNPIPLEVNLRIEPLPYIQGSVITAHDLTNVRISVIRGTIVRTLQETTSFENPRNFAINVLPVYDTFMTGIRVVATDVREQISTKEFELRVVDRLPPPEIAFTTPGGLVVDFNQIQSFPDDIPKIQGSVTTKGELTNVRIFTVTTENTRQLVGEYTSFTTPGEFTINVQPNYVPNVNRLRVIATDYLGQIDSSDFNLQVVDFTMPTELTPATGPRLAFPTAEGAGRYTVGGRGGRVLVVTNLNNAGEGSFRWAVEQSGARTIIFDVSGEINLTSRLNINNHNITIAGQSAPGDGITIRGHRFVLNNANQVIVRFLRIRPGQHNNGDAFEGQQRSNVILDHLSMSWADDEIASFYNNRYFTMQWSIISEPFGAGSSRGMGGLMGGHTATFANNLFAHTRSRNPRINGARLSGRNPDLEMADFVNNVIFNHGTSANGGELGRYNFQHNFFIPGPATPQGHARNRFLLAYARNETTNNPATFRDFGTFYISGNVMEGNTAITNNNWGTNVLNAGNAVHLETSAQSNRRNLESVQATTPFMPEWAVRNMRSGQAILDTVLDRAGASFRRDAVDTRIVHETRTRTATFGNGHVSGDVVPGTWPVLNSEPPAPRFLRGTVNDDGIPDWFKIKHRLPLGQNMANRHSISPYFTNLEMYLNSLVEHIHNP